MLSHITHSNTHTLSHTTHTLSLTHNTHTLIIYSQKFTHSYTAYSYNHTLTQNTNTLSHRTHSHTHKHSHSHTLLNINAVFLDSGYVMRNGNICFLGHNINCFEGVSNIFYRACCKGHNKVSWL
jgi:hypothetical protein